MGGEDLPMTNVKQATDTFTCADCGETFPKGRSDEEAAAERERDFPGLEEADMVVVCDDCYNAMRAKAAAVNFPWGTPEEKT